VRRDVKHPVERRSQVTKCVNHEATEINELGLSDHLVQRNKVLNGRIEF